MSLVKWVDGYYDNKADVPLEKIGDGKDLPEWVESELKESLEYMMELHRQKMAAKIMVHP